MTFTAPEQVLLLGRTSTGTANTSPLWSPAAPAGLIAWYDASLTSSITSALNRVTAWADRSASGFNLAAAGTARPSTGLRTRNNLNVLTFDGVANNLFVAAVPLAAVNTMTAFAVIYPTAPVFSERVFSLDKSNNDFGGADRIAAILRGTGDLNAFGSYLNGDGAKATIVPNTNAIHQITTQRNGDATLARADGTAGTPTSGHGTTNFAIDTINVGAYGGEAVPASFFTGDICEILLYNTALSAANILTVEAYLKNKWATP